MLCCPQARHSAVCTAERFTGLLGAKAGLAVSDFPGYRGSTFFKNMPSTLKPFYPILQATMHHRPVTSADDYYMGQLDSAPPPRRRAQGL